MKGIDYPTHTRMTLSHLRKVRAITFPQRNCQHSLKAFNLILPDSTFEGERDSAKGRRGINVSNSIGESDLLINIS